MSIRGWTRFITIRRDAGRHRRGSGDPGWELLAQEVAEPNDFAWCEVPATGLRKFNLGTIPASVTPPRSWRRAAWFAVGTAAFVVCALGFAAVALVGNPRKSTTIDALPEEPSQRLAITDRTAGSSADQPDAPPPAGTVAGTMTTSTIMPPAATNSRTPGQVARQGPVPPARTGAPQRPAAPRPTTPTRTRPAARPPAPTTGPPVLNTAPVPLAQQSQASLRGLTERYFALVARDPRAAHELTAGSLWAEGPHRIRARYAGVARIDIKKITVDRARSCTETKLVLMYRDGRKKFGERRLTFTSGPDPRITGDTAIS